MTTKELSAACWFLKRQQTEDGTTFEETYTEAGLTFTPADVEAVRQEPNGGVCILFWRGNSNLGFDLSAAEWQEALTNA